MERDDFIIYVYCLVCDLYQQFQQRYCQRRSLRGGGFAPALSDAEVITIEVCGEYFKQHTDQDIFDYFMAHYRHFFPQLKERTAFVRQAAALWQVKLFIQQRLVQRAGVDADAMQVIDTLPLPVCTLTRGCRDRCFVNAADYGYCAAKKLHYYGFKLGLRVARCGMIVDFPLLAARPHDIQHLDTLVEDFEGVVAADKGFIDAWRQAVLQERHGVLLVTPQRKNSKRLSPHSRQLQRACAYWRKRVETVGSQLVQHFAVTRIRVRDLWHLQHRLIRKVLAHTTAVFLNLQLGRAPLDLDDLLTH